MTTLPPLPEPAIPVAYAPAGCANSVLTQQAQKVEFIGTTSQAYFTADQMHTHAVACVSAERASLLAVLKQAGEALTTSLKQLETLAGKRRKHPNEGQDEIHAEVLEIVDAALAAIKALEQ